VRMRMCIWTARLRSRRYDSVMELFLGMIHLEAHFEFPPLHQS